VLMVRALAAFPGRVTLVLSGRDYTAKEFLEYAHLHPEWTAALRTLPESADLHNGFGIALATTGQSAAAAAQFQRALQLQPGFEEARRNLAALSGAGDDRRR